MSALLVASNLHIAADLKCASACIINTCACTIAFQMVVCNCDLIEAERTCIIDTCAIAITVSIVLSKRNMVENEFTFIVDTTTVALVMAMLDSTICNGQFCTCLNLYYITICQCRINDVKFAVDGPAAQIECECLAGRNDKSSIILTSYKLTINKSTFIYVSQRIGVYPCVDILCLNLCPNVVLHNNIIVITIRSRTKIILFVFDIISILGKIIIGFGRSTCSYSLSLCSFRVAERLCVVATSKL